MYASFVLTCSFDTREDAKIYMTGFYKSCSGMEFRSFSLKNFPLRCRMFFADFSSPSSGVAFEFGAGEDNRIFRLWAPPLFPEASSRLDLHESPFEHCPCVLTWKHSPTFQRWLSFPFDSWSLLLSLQLRSRLWNFEFSSFDQDEVKQCLQSWITRLSSVSDGFLFVQSQDSLKLNRVL